MTEYRKNYFRSSNILDQIHHVFTKGKFLKMSVKRQQTYKHTLLYRLLLYDDEKTCKRKSHRVCFQNESKNIYKNQIIEVLVVLSSHQIIFWKPKSFSTKHLY